MDSMIENIAPGIFLSLIWGWKVAPSQFKNEQKFPQKVFIIRNFLFLHFGENFIKIQTKIAKLEIHENSHKMWMKTFFMKGNQSNKYVTALYC